MQTPTERTCRLCGSKFMGIRNACLCSPECKYKAILEANRESQKKRLGRTRKPESLKHEKGKCPVCGSEFEKSRTNQKYCSNICQEERQQDRRAAFAELRGLYEPEYEGQL